MSKIFDPAGITFTPEAESALAGQGLSLAALFDLCLAKDAVVRRMVESASGHTFTDHAAAGGALPYDCDGLAMLERGFLWHQACWPVDLRGYDLFVEWCDRAGARFANQEPDQRGGRLNHLEEGSVAGDEALLSARGAARMVSARYVAMIALLRSEVLEAFGHHNGSGAVARISSVLWSTPKTRVDFNQNELHVLKRVDFEYVSENRARAIRREITDAIWSGVSVKRRDEKSDEKAPATEVSPAMPRNPGGAEPKYPWDSAFDRLTIRIGSKDGLPQTGAELARMLADCLEKEGFPDPDLDYVKQHLRNKHPMLWQACLKKS